MPRQPVYVQIADDLRRQIDAGALAPGSQLPTEHELREKYNASRNTVRDAIQRLVELHLVEGKPGKGTFVSKTVDRFVTDLSPQQVGRQIRGCTAGPLSVVSSTEYPAEVAALLGLPSGAEVISRTRDRYIADDLWSVETSYYPRRWAEDGAGQLLRAEDISEQTHRYLGTVLGLREVRCEDWIAARPAKDDESMRFGLPHNTAMFLIYRTGFTADGTPIRVTATIYPADRNEFRYHFDNLPG